VNGKQRPGWALALIPAAALCTAVVLFVFRDPLFRSLELPLAYLVWAARVVAARVGQRIVWAALVIVVAAAGLGSLRARGTGRRQAAGPPRQEGSRTRIAFWQSVVPHGDANWFSDQLLAVELRRLALSVLEHTEGRDASELERRMERGETDIPASIRELFTRQRQPEPRRVSFLRRRFRKVGPSGPVMDKRQVAQILSDLEKRLGSTDRILETET
jgi:hypothetical protein